MENNEPQLNVRKSLKSDLAMNTPTSNVPARKTLMHTMNEQNRLKIENVGFQNSMFSLANVEEHLARLGRLHLILEHLILIQSQLKLDQGNSFERNIFFDLKFNILLLLQCIQHSSKIYGNH